MLHYSFYCSQNEWMGAVTETIWHTFFDWIIGDGFVVIVLTRTHRSALWFPSNNQLISK